MIKRFIIIFMTLLLPFLSADAQEKNRKKIRLAEKEIIRAIEDTLTNEYLDTVNIRKKFELNDYSMIGLHYGVGLSQVMWNPTQKQDMLIMPMNVGVTYTKYGKMFGYMPYFGFQAGLIYTTEGYQFEYDEENDYTTKVEGAEKAVMKVVGQLNQFKRVNIVVENNKLVVK